MNQNVGRDSSRHSHYHVGMNPDLQNCGSFALLLADRKNGVWV